MHIFDLYIEQVILMSSNSIIKTQPFFFFFVVMDKDLNLVHKKDTSLASKHKKIC